MENVSETVIETIEARGVTPKSWWRFFVTRTAFWLLALASVAVGGIAFAVGVFVFLDNDGLSVAQLEQSSIFDIAQGIPFIWLFILGLFIASAYFGFRHTRRGYRYSTALIVTVIIAASVILGVMLNAFDFGERTHKYLLEHTNFYDPLIHSREDVTRDAS